VNLKGNEKILIIKPSAFGDVIHALALLNSLKSAYPGLSIFWLVNKEYADLLANNPLIERLYIFDRKRWGRKRNLPATMREIGSLLNSVRRERFDLIIDLQCLLRSGLITRFSGAGYRIGLSDAREGSGFCYNYKVEVTDKKRHAVDRYLKVAQFFGIDTKKQKVAFPLIWSKDEDSTIRSIIPSSGKIRIAINAHARWESKCWSQARFARVADKLIHDYHADVVFTGGPGDVAAVENIAMMMRETPILAAGKTSALELAALLAAMDLVITNDSGPMHLSVAVNVPVIALFGPTDPLKTGPYGNGNIVIHKTDGRLCAPCMRKECLKPQHCMDAICVEDVLEAVDIIIEKKKHAGI